jgi:phosphatidylserine decarboxylase
MSEPSSNPLELAYINALRVLPRSAVSRAFGAISEIELPHNMRAIVNGGFAALAGIDTSEAAAPPAAYPSLNAYFTRKLKVGARPAQAHAPGQLVSPVDGRLTQLGSLEDATLIQAKGRTYRLDDLLDSGAQARRFEGGVYMTIYLSPRDYHRIHSPADAEITGLSYIPGTLWPVNPLSVRHVDDLFAVNERVVSYLDSPDVGALALIKVGATCVGRITLSYHDLQSNGAFRRRRDVTLERPVPIGVADELAAFNLGSTVILLVEDPSFTLRAGLELGQKVKVGELLGAVDAHDADGA